MLRIQVENSTNGWSIFIDGDTIKNGFKKPYDAEQFIIDALNAMVHTD